MRAFLFPAFLSFSLAATSLPAQTAADQIGKFYEEELAHSPAYENLRVLTTQFPGRIAGSTAYDGATRWAEQTLREMGCDDVRLQPVTVHRWERGAPESVTLIDPGAGSAGSSLNAVALGWSVSTPQEGLRAPVVEVQGLDELAKLGRDGVAGKIVFFNRPMRVTNPHPGKAYGEAGDQRNRGPGEAAKLGAVGALVRSLTQRQDDIPHTGNTTFAPDQPKIPAAALSLVAANRLSAALKKNLKTEVEIKIHAKTLPDGLAHNVIAEIRGSEFPDEIILVGGHLDCWDIAAGAHDDGSGVVQSMEVLRLFHALGIQPRHTLRCVLFAAEENSLAGGIEYARVVREKKEKHIFALESDGGGFEPNGFDVGHTSLPAHERAARWRELFEPYGHYNFVKGTGGADIGPLMVQGVTVAELRPDSQRYFDYHHTRIDTIEQVNPRELQLGAAAMAALIWLVDTQGL